MHNRAYSTNVLINWILHHHAFLNTTDICSYLKNEILKTITGNIVDVISKTITKGKILFENGKIIAIEPTDIVDNQYIIPGFVDAHIHIESSMMLPSEFARYSVIHGTVACVCDPHEMANVCGVKGIDYMIENGRNSPMALWNNKLYN